MYIYKEKNWPLFTWNTDQIIELLSTIRFKQGSLSGKMAVLGFELKNEVYLESLSNDVIKSSEIEGEFLDVAQVRSSIARKLGVDIGGLIESERHVEGIVEMMLDATQNWNSTLTPERLYNWHSALFTTGRSGMYKIVVGKWRDGSSGPMRVVSGPMGRENVHFVAPHYSCLSEEMDVFLKWLNKQHPFDPIIKAAISHLWFITIHPFEDGNGRIARAITDMLLCKSEKHTQRFYSMSSQILLNKKGYYSILESTQKGDLDITEWILWFLNCLDQSLDQSTEIVNRTIAKHSFWNNFKNVSFNKRQLKIIHLLFDNYFGKLTTSKWAKINKCSSDTALRDIQELIKFGVLIKAEDGGRSTNYILCN